MLSTPIISTRNPTFLIKRNFFILLQASDDKRSQKEIADIAGVADVTIRQSYKLMLPRAAELFPEGFKFATPIANLPQS